MEENLNKLIKTFPGVVSLAKLFNKYKIRWSIAAGSAYYVITGDTRSLDDVDIWISTEDKTKVENILQRKWDNKQSDKHKAKNIEFKEFDLFTDCKKLKNKKTVLDYVWTSNVDKHLTEINIGGVNYPILNPVDVALLKIANPRDDIETKQAERLLSLSNKRYLEVRKKECGYQN